MHAQELDKSWGMLWSNNDRCSHDYLRGFCNGTLDLILEIAISVEGVAFLTSPPLGAESAILMAQHFEVPWDWWALVLVV